MRKSDECGMEKFGTLDSSEKTIAILGDRWWPQKAKRVGDKMSKKLPCARCGKNVSERPNVEGILLGVGTGAPSREGCVVNAQMTINKSGNK